MIAWIGWQEARDAMWHGVVVMTLAYALWRWFRRSVDPLGLGVRILVSVVLLVGLFGLFGRVFGGRGPDVGGGMVGSYALAFVLAGLAAACGLVLTIIWGPSLIEWIGSFFTSFYDGGVAEDTGPPPRYAMIEAWRKQGRVRDALALLRADRARNPLDFQGLLLQATMEAEDLKDLEAAVGSVEEILAIPGLPAANGALVLNRLADWHLKLAEDLEAASACLERVIAVYGGTEQASYAEQRLAHLAGVVSQQRDRAEHPPIVLKRSEERLGLRPDFKGIELPKPDPGVEARRLLDQLEVHPHDAEVRTRLARIYAEEYGRLDLAVDQMEQLLAQEHAPQKQVIGWLNTLADLHIRVGSDEAGARAALERILQRYPKSAAAETAKNRLVRLRIEIRGRRAGGSVRLGGQGGTEG